MIFFFIIRHQNPNEKHHRHSAQNPRIKFYAKKSAKIGFSEPFCRSSPNFATDLLQTCYKRLKRGPPTRFIINMQKWIHFTFAYQKARRYKKKPLTFSGKRPYVWWRIRDSNPRPPACDAGALTSWANPPYSVVLFGAPNWNVIIIARLRANCKPYFQKISIFFRAAFRLRSGAKSCILKAETFRRKRGF